MASHMRGEYKTCIRYGMTRAGRRCAKYGPARGLRGADDVCVKYKKTCTRYKRSLKRFGRRRCIDWEDVCVKTVPRHRVGRG